MRQTHKFNYLITLLEKKTVKFQGSVGINYVGGEHGLHLLVNESK